MKIALNGKTLFVDWKYENPELEAILTSNGISEKQYREMKFKDLVEMLGTSQLPAPKFTACFIKDENREVLAEARTIRSVKDQFCKEVGRRYSLAKTLRVLLPDRENKALRREFWNQYLVRNKKEKNVKQEHQNQKVTVVGSLETEQGEPRKGL